MGRNISVMGGAGGGQWPEHRTDNRHWFAIDWLGHKDGMVSRGRREEESGLLNLPLSCHQIFFFLCLASSSSVVTAINRRAHLHPDRDKCNDSSGRPRDDTAITAGCSFVFEMAPR